ncbi:hypothetical protein Gocc_0423 [Gaiella occulta]|uniref:Uncharacterized protein n=1 Tax=Gaiella occulta TaxID=1002870 RepID=A0A7M2Z295_9ACTN|nr:hypothetical protein [Gaiella occulta]RDI76004.1 hypothetical protein Gocc_0423 [Gaiella occulta]
MRGRTAPARRVPLPLPVVGHTIFAPPPVRRTELPFPVTLVRAEPGPSRPDVRHLTLALEQPRAVAVRLPASTIVPKARRGPFPPLRARLLRESLPLGDVPRQRLAWLVRALLAANPGLAVERLTLVGIYERAPVTHLVSLTQRDGAIEFTVLPDRRPVRLGTLVVGRDERSGRLATAVVAADDQARRSR